MFGDIGKEIEAEVQKLESNLVNEAEAVYRTTADRLATLEHFVKDVNAGVVKDFYSTRTEFEALVSKVETFIATVSKDLGLK